MPSPPTGLSPPPLKRRRLSPSPSPNLHPSPTPNSPLLTPPTSLHIYAWNINGIPPFLPSPTRKITPFLTTTTTTTTSPSPPNHHPHPPSHPPPRPSLRACLRAWKWPHLLLLQEVQIARTDTKTRATIQRAINPSPDADADAKDETSSYDAHFCLPSDQHNAAAFGGKVYGVCTLIRRDVEGASVKRVEWDMEGRVLVVEMARWGVVVVNVYAVNGSANDYRDAQTGKVVGDRHGRKREFHSLLAREVGGYEERGWGVVVGGDVNVSRSKIDSFPRLRLGEEHVRNRADFEDKFIRGLGMVDTFRAVHGEERKFTYRPRNKPWGAGGDRVDMILTTKGLKESIKEADILDSEEDRGPSDHVPLFVELEVGKIDKGEKG